MEESKSAIGHLSRYENLIRDGVVADQSELALFGRITTARMTQIMSLLNLASNWGRRDTLLRSDGLPAPKGHSHNRPGQSAAAQPRSAALGKGGH